MGRFAPPCLAQWWQYLPILIIWEFTGGFDPSLGPLSLSLGPPVFWSLFGLSLSEPSEDSLRFLRSLTTTLVASRQLRRERKF